MTAWAVYCNGRDTGIVETNLAFAKAYWARRSTFDRRFTLLERIV